LLLLVDISDGSFLSWLSPLLSPVLSVCFSLYSIAFSLFAFLFSFCPWFSRSWANQAFSLIADQVFPFCLQKLFFDQLIVFRILILDQRPLHGFFPVVPGHIDFFSCPGVCPCVIHAGRQGGRGRIEILHLFRHKSQIPHILCQLHRVFQRTARMGGH